MYFICETCNAKWFQSGELRQCPRCGAVAAGEDIEAPWTMKTVEETARALRVSSRLVYKLVETGKISAYRIGSAIRISDEQLQSYLRGCEGHTAPSAQERPTTLRRLRV